LNGHVFLPLKINYYFFRMKNQNRVLLLLLSLLLIHISCKKSDDSVQTPPKAKNTFSCKINGVLWEPYWRCAELATAGMAELHSTIQSADGNHALPLYVNVQMGNSKLGKTVFLLQQDPPPIGTYIHHTGNVIDSLHIQYITDSMAYINYFFPDRHSARYFNIETLDTVNHIISGSFAFTLYGNRPSDNALDSVAVTEGQFDFEIGEFSRCSN
jgi:hypothetical protein